ncbi:PucR family transcriptional regulator [Clostridium sp. MD294]|uniref:PucR family transcriptional regulator n=1 Tax=Clostridium sp. MD294 TaxID=97138 RepID=UPI0002C8FBAD|nr:PucR family transcriptional regulator [Clostridium sp. MD294]NDO47089.1 hypothetical protein [Clostridium sp. MD294]USF31141.1 Purine catabolism regulatory protein [Clostridium sp. MD294]
MKISLREAISFGGLFHAEILAGENKLDTIFIESVTTIEVTDHLIGEWVKENQLCITTMYAIRDNLQQQLNLVKILQEKKCAALVVCHVGIWIEYLDTSFISLCKTEGLPLIKPDMHVSYLDILNPLIYRLMSNDKKKNLSYHELNKEILDMIIQGESLSNIIKKATKYYKNQVTFLDSYCHCIYSSKTWKQVEEEKIYIRKNFNIVFSHLLRNSFLDTIELLPDKLIYLVQTKNNVLGFLILDTPKELERTKNKILQIAETLNTICALVIGKQTHTMQMKEYYIHEYVTDLLVWNFRTENEAITRGIEAGIQLKNKNIFILVNLNSFRNLNNIDKESLYIEQIRVEILPKINQKIMKIDSEAFLHLYSDQIFILLDLKKQKEILTQRMDEIIYIFDKNKISVSVGISEEFASIKNIPTAYKEATQAYNLGRQYFGEKKAIHYSDIYFFQEIMQLKQKEETILFSNKVLQKLIDYDKQHHTELLHTLAMLLKYNGNITSIAELMHLHRNTLLYRKNKILEILGYSPFEMPYYFSIIIALQINEMF